VSAWDDDLMREYKRLMAAIDGPRRRKGGRSVTIVVVHRSRSGTWRTKRKQKSQPGVPAKQKQETTT
jgi:hypothetical protein